VSTLRGHRVAVVSGDGLVGRSDHGLLVVHGHPDAIDALLTDHPLASRDGIDALRRTAVDGLPDGIVGLVVGVWDHDHLNVAVTGPEHVSVDGVEPASERSGQARMHRIGGDGHVRLGVAIGRVGNANDLCEGVVPGAGVELIAAPVPGAQAPVRAPERSEPSRLEPPKPAPTEPLKVSEPPPPEPLKVSPPERSEPPRPEPPAHPTPAVQASPPVPAPPIDVTNQASLAVSRGSESADQQRGPSPTTLSQPRTDTGELVEGILCARQHFNNPLARYCQVCGISMVHLTHNLVERPRPTLGFIVFDDGTTIALDRSYAIGREPPTGGDTDLTPLVVDDDEHSVSRAHAELRLVGWQVVLRDLRSSNGTHVWDTQSSSWRKLPAGEQATLNAGTYAAVGRRVFVYQPSVRQ
jgi:hypothetical protein